VGSGAPGLLLPDKPSIAVLAFQSMSGDPEQEYFADGMVERQPERSALTAVQTGALPPDVRPCALPGLAE
jgi:hypothetical protein